MHPAPASALEVFLKPSRARADGFAACREQIELPLRQFLDRGFQSASGFAC